MVRHGQCFVEAEDPLQHLTEKGKSDAQKIALLLKKAQLKIDVIFTSTKVRAIETAEIFAAELVPAGKVLQRAGLSPNDSAEEFLESIEFDENDIMVVGHLPFLSHLASLLLSKDQNKVDIFFSKCAVVCLEKKGQGDWQLEFAINPSLLPM